MPVGDAPGVRADEHVEVGRLVGRPRALRQCGAWVHVCQVLQKAAPPGSAAQRRTGNAAVEKQRPTKGVKLRTQVNGA